MSKSRKTIKQEALVNQYLTDLKKEIGEGNLKQDEFMKILVKPMGWCKENFNGEKVGTVYNHIVQQITNHLKTLKK
tara:strand:+ start:375 stop:602 length:228 start_codon:yes stop_codon:yes gene_type:complete